MGMRAVKMDTNYQYHLPTRSHTGLTEQLEAAKFTIKRVLHAGRLGSFFPMRV